MQQQEKNKALALKWKNAWAINQFRTKTIIGSILLSIVLVSFPRFFALIEMRKGIVLQDYLLEQIPSADLSIPIFIIIWGTALLLLNRLIKDPAIFLQFLLSFLVLCISRIISIWLVQLDPPIGLIPLNDPVTSIFYGGKNVFIQKDLFYSGHTATQFLMFLTLKKRNEKIITGITTLLIAILVLIQHVHYTIDVLAAFPLTLLVYFVGKKIATY